MASSSSSLTTGRGTYDVFLSFRGEDTRNSFVDHLYAALDQRGIQVFKDDKMIRKGKMISPELVKAIEDSRFAVVVFSKNYANSSWCLDELVRIMECQDTLRETVLPVFYHVDPSDVRKQKGNFARAFHLHEEEFKESKDKVNKWREALAAASNLCGWHISEKVNGGEYAFIIEIVRDILAKIGPRGRESNLIGIESRMEALNSLLNIEATEEVRMVGICGMGGIGKTTIAQTLFKRIAYKFEASSFVEDVRKDSCSKRDICALQEKIVKDILLLDDDKLMIKDPDEGVYKIQDSCCNKRVLLVLDDVDNSTQLEFLASTHQWFGLGSRIIITTRNEHLLSYVDAIYKPVFLLKDQALELFSRHAFQKNNPPKGYEKLSDQAMRYTGYLPLAVKVLGSYFHGRKAYVWESAFNKLAKSQNLEIFETLKLSYDGLDDSEKKLFLDIACFYKGKDKEHVTRVLDSFGFDAVIGISVLREKCLITISNNTLDMHDLIQEMGWKIVRDSAPNSRLWKIEEVCDLIQKNKKLKAIEAIVVLYKQDILDQWDEEMGLRANVFESMKNLRLLAINRKFTSCEPTSFPCELQWLCWNEYPFSFLPMSSLRKLVGLEILYGNIEHLWVGQKKMLNLKYIHFQRLYRLTRFPDVSWFPNIERLILSCCSNLVEVHDSLGSHRRLVYLDMSNCHRLKFLPLILKMESLETLNLSHCYLLQRFPEISPCMVKLSNINLVCCSKLEELPSSIRYLSSLSFLTLEGCFNLKIIPASIRELKNLKCLHLDNCSRLQKFPHELGRMEMLEELTLGLLYGNEESERLQKSISFHSLTSLSSLRKLDLSQRQIEDKDFPKNLHGFSSLEELYLSGNTKLIHLPASISKVSRLKRLELNECCELRYIPMLPSGIQVLEANDCTSLEKMECLSKDNKWLHKLSLFNCHKLLKYQENGRYLDKMLQQSFIKKWAAADQQSSIAYPRSTIPCWFKEQHNGDRIALKVPPKWHSEIMGVMVCVVFRSKYQTKYHSPCIQINIKDATKYIPKSEVDCADTSESAKDDNVFISYIPFNLFTQTHGGFPREDWSHVIDGILVINLDGCDVVRWGAHIMYKEDIEPIKQLKQLYI